MNSTGPAASGPRSLSQFDATCVVIGAIIGVGIFFSPGQVAAQAGSVSLALAAWCVGGLIALCGAFTFAELGGRYHANGAQYAVLRDAYGSAAGFVFVFCNATAVQAGAMGVIALVCINNLNVVLKVDPWESTTAMWLSVVLIVALMLANLAGVRWGSRIQNLTVLTKLLALAVIVVLGLVSPASAELDATAAAKIPNPTLLGFLAATVPTIFAYGGWQHALWLAGEVKNPSRVIPRAIMIGVIIVIAVYLSANWAYFRLMPLPQVATSKTLAADALAQSGWFAGWGPWLIALAVTISALGVLNAQLLSGPRLIQGMLDDFFFRRRGTSQPARVHSPAGAILALGVLASLLLFAAGKNGLDKLTTGVVFVDGTFFALTGFSLLLLPRARRDAADGPGSFRAPLFPLVPLLFVLGIGAVVVGSFANPEVRGASLVGVAWIGAALGVFGLVSLLRRLVSDAPRPPET